jgi:hypothetical protein
MSKDPAIHVTTRPPILQATTTLGVPDREVARRVGVSPIVVSDWNRGVRPIPKLRHAAMQLVVERLLWSLSTVPAWSEKDDRRIQVAREVAQSWLNLSYEELGPVPGDVEVAAAGIVLGVEESVRDLIQQVEAAEKDDALKGATP